jgi:hypothetical protein
MTIEPYCCDTPRPKGFTYFPNVTVCDTCLTQFPYYDCYCELQHDDCNEARAKKNMAYQEATRPQIEHYFVERTMSKL